MKENVSITRILEISVPALIMFAVSWGIYTTKSNAQELKILDLEKKYETVLELKGDIGIIKNDINYIKVALDKHDDE
jgi:hypothetical protein